MVQFLFLAGGSASGAFLGLGLDFFGVQRSGIEANEALPLRA